MQVVEKKRAGPGPIEDLLGLGERDNPDIIKKDISENKKLLKIDDLGKKLARFNFDMTRFYKEEGKEEEGINQDDS